MFAEAPGIPRKVLRVVCEGGRGGMGLLGGTMRTTGVARGAGEGGGNTATLSVVRC